MSLFYQNLFFWFLFIRVILLGTSTFGQFSEVLSSVRPGVAYSPYTVGLGGFQTSNGFDYFNQFNRFGRGVSFVSTNQFQYGILESFELSSVVDFGWDPIKDVAIDPLEIYGLKNIQFGFRTNVLVSPIGLVPSMAYQILIALPMNGKDYETKYVAPEIIFIFENKITNELSVVTNGVMLMDGNVTTPTWGYIFNVNYNLNQFNFFIEHFASVKRDKYIYNFDIGLAYNVNHDLQFDLYSGISELNSRTNFFVSLGLTWRFYMYGPHMKKVLLQSE